MSLSKMKKEDLELLSNKDITNLILEGNQEKYLSIRINKIYNGEINTSQMVFSDIINNKNTFDSTTDKSSYNDISTIEINFN